MSPDLVETHRTTSLAGKCEKDCDSEPDPLLAAREPNIRVVGKHVRDAVPQVQEGSQQQVQDAIDGLKLIALRVDELLPRSKVSCSNTLTHKHTQAPMSFANVRICAHHLAPCKCALAVLSMRPLPAKSTLATDNERNYDRAPTLLFVFCKCCDESGLEVLIVIKTPTEKCVPVYFLNTLANFIQREALNEFFLLLSLTIYLCIGSFWKEGTKVAGSLGSQLQGALERSSL